MSIFSTFTQHDFRSPSCGHQRTEEIKGIQVGKEVKLALFADDMILDIEKPHVAVRKLLELINELVKLQDTKLIPSDFLKTYGKPPVASCLQKLLPLLFRYFEVKHLSEIIRSSFAGIKFSSFRSFIHFSFRLS